MIGSLRGVVLDRVGRTARAPRSCSRWAASATGCWCPSGALGQIGAPGSPAFLHVHTHVREDAIVLYGFPSRDERACFEALIGAHGVGPAVALALLSVHSPAALQRAVLADDADALMLVPGIGKKTAVRLLVELKSPAGPRPRRGRPASARDATRGGGSAAGDRWRRTRAEVRAALAGLGYGADEIRHALGRLPADGALEDQITPGPPRAGRRPVSRRSAPDPRGLAMSGSRPMREEGLDRPVGACAPTRWRRPKRSPCGPGGWPSSSARPSSRSTSRSCWRRPAGESSPPTTCCSPGRPGLGKTSLAGIVANEMGAGFRITSGPALVRAGDLAAILTNLAEGDVLFVDEIHRLGRAVEEILYPAMEDFQLDIVLGKGPSARTIRLDLPPLHPGRRHHPHRAHHRPAPRPVRLRGPPRLLQRRRPRRHHPPVGGHPRRPPRRLRARPRSPAGPGARPASPTAC